MKDKYYYFVASLPSIEFDDKPPITIEAFIDDARRLLKHEHAELLHLIINDDFFPSDNETFERWRQFDHQLRNQIAFARARKEGYQDANVFVRGEREINPLIVEVVDKAIKEDNPLKAIRMIDQFRWHMLDDLKKRTYFDMDFLITYALKLRILYRYEIIRSPKGKEMFDQFKDLDLISERLEEERI